MAQLLVRNLEEDVKSRLRERAARHGRSMEAEVRDILRDATKDEVPRGEERGLGTRIAELFRGIGLRPGETLERPPQGDTIENPFEE